MIPSNKTYLPPREEYDHYLDALWESRWITNNGSLLCTLEQRLASFFGAEHVRAVSNGTMALQLSIRALDLEGEVITTPFSYVATTGALLWERCDPVFVDIDPKTFNLDPANVEAAITPDTCALLPTHVFGVCCDVQQMRQIADRYDLSLIYDGAHAFGTEVEDRSLLRYGDMTAISFHATKLFHTVEGGAVITDDPELAEQVELMRAFGHRGHNYERMGTNAKASEFHAAMGLCLLPRVADFIERRCKMYTLYRSKLQHLPLSFQEIPAVCNYNYAYFPVLFPSEEDLTIVREQLEQQEIRTRRYFNPALNRLPYLDGTSCPIAEEVADRVLCLPFFQEITTDEIESVTTALTEAWPREYRSRSVNVESEPQSS